MQERAVVNLSRGGNCSDACASSIRWFFTVCIVTWAIAGSLANAADSPSPKNVLVLYSFSKREVFDPEALKSEIRSRSSAPVNFYIEYLESQRFRTPGYENDLSKTLRDTYGKQKLDLVIVASYPALSFAVEFRERIFPGVPIVFMSVAPGRIQGRKLWSGVTGVTIPSDIRGTLELALRLQPDTKNVAVVAGDSEFERYWLGLTNQELGLHAGQLKVIDLVGLPVDQLLRKVSQLPRHTVIFFQLIPQESTQTVIGTYDLLAAIAQQFPTYCIHNYCFDHGGIGGSYPDSDEQRSKAAGLAARILEGEDPDGLTVLPGTQVRPQVDWRELRRWNLPESRLPANTLILYRQPAVWERYEKLIFAGIVLLVVQALLIAGLLRQRARKQKIEASLRESEERFRRMADTSPALIWLSDLNGKVSYVSARRIEFTGSDPEAGLGDTWMNYIHPEDRHRVAGAFALAQQTREPFSKEYRLRRRDGEYRWMFDVAAPRTDGNGTFAGFIGSAIDITDQRLAQQALEKVSGKLIEAQESERTRIARELHDDICQRLSLLSLELEQVSQTANGSRDRLIEIRRHCSEIAGDVQTLSHKLHSTKLDYLGIVAALRSFCHEFSKQQDVTVNFSHQNVPTSLPREISLCLFRIAQEALHNAFKHSETREFGIRLLGAADSMELEVTDQGAGFNLEAARKQGGLGLVSMQERIHLVKGSLSIESQPGCGTKVVARVPLATAAEAAADSAWEAVQQ